MIKILQSRGYRPWGSGMFAIMDFLSIKLRSEFKIKASKIDSGPVGQWAVYPELNLVNLFASMSSY